MLSGCDVGRPDALPDKFQMPIGSLVGLVQILGDKVTGQIWPSHVEVSIYGFLQSRLE